MYFKTAVIHVNNTFRITSTLKLSYYIHNLVQQILSGAKL